jgi:2-polyprenyl-6-methoxyphenol hydroxylase-like FAD-dependent oxidoreductase
MTATRSSDPDVLIIGAGPTGLVAAAQLAARGVSVRIIDAAPVRSDKSRALGVQARTLELFDKMGVADRLVSLGKPSLGMRLHVEGRQVARLPIDDLGIDHTRFPYLLFVSQVQTERVLDEHLAALGVSVERPVTLVGLEQDEHGVTARVQRYGRDETIRARYLLGADGAHSAVRHALELPFHGDAYASDFVLGDVEASGDLAFEELLLFVSRKGVLIVFPMGGSTVRVMATGFALRSDAGDPTVEELQEQVTRLSGRPDFRIERATWVSRFRLHHRGVDRYRVGRVFLAGDAAHIHSPAGGQGMNTGIQDAYNLAWKLAMVVQGHADEVLLDSYQAERLPVGRRLLRFTDRLFSMMSTLSPVMGWLRTKLAPVVVPHLLSTRRSNLFLFASQLGIRYRRSPAVAEHLEHADARFREGPRAGDRAPGAPLPQGHFLSRLHGPGWWLLGFCGHGEGSTDGERLQQRLAAAAADAPWIRTLIIARTPAPEHEGWVHDPEGTLHDRYGLRGPGIVLVRPDGHIAFRSAGVGVDPLCRWLDAQRPASASTTTVELALPPAEPAAAARTSRAPQAV